MTLTFKIQGGGGFPTWIILGRAAYLNGNATEFNIYIADVLFEMCWKQTNIIMQFYTSEKMPPPPLLC